MAGARLRPSAALVLLVLAGHALLLQALASRLAGPAPLRPMADPVLTRVLQPQSPAEMPKRPADGNGSRSSAIKNRVLPEPVDPLLPQVTAQPATPPTATPSTAAADPATDGAAASASGDAAAPTTPAPDAAALLAAAQAAGRAAGGTEPPATVPAVAAGEARPAAPADAGDPLAAWPADTRLRYSVEGWFRGELTGDAQVQWQRSGERYETRVDISVGLVASLRFVSQGLVTPHGLVPAAYEEQRGQRRRQLRLEPDRLILHDGRELPRPPGAQDSASQFIDLAHAFAQGTRPLTPGGAISLWLARPGGVNLWTYDVVGFETVDLPRLGAIPAWHLRPQPIPDARGNIVAEMWFAPSLQYLPVRILIRQGEEAWLDLRVDRIEQR